MVSAQGERLFLPVDSRFFFSRHFFAFSLKSSSLKLSLSLSDDNNNNSEEEEEEEEEEDFISVRCCSSSSVTLGLVVLYIVELFYNTKLLC